MRGLPLAAAIFVGATAVPLGGGAAASSPAPTFAQALKTASAPGSELARGRTIVFGDTKVVQYQQEVGGVPVLGGQVAVIGDTAGTEAPTVASDGSAAKVATPPAPKVSAAQAIAIARRSTGADGLRATPTARLAIDPQHGNALVRQVTIASARPLKDLLVLVDATTGRVIQTTNVAHYASSQTGTAKVFTPNPVAVNGGYGGIGAGKRADRNDRNTRKLTALRRRVSLTMIDKHQTCLKGAFVQVRLGRRARPVCRRGLNWSKVKRADNRFEALEAYYEITHLQTFYRALGFRGTASVHPKPQLVVVDAMPDDNSFYTPFDRKIRYGSGGVDDAEDGDVITHEYGHSIQDAQDRGFGNCNCTQASALGEGFGDFESAVNTAISPAVPHSDLRRAEYCIVDWDGTGGYSPQAAPCGRLATGADHTNTYAQALIHCRSAGGTDPHCLGEVWSHGLIDLLNKLPADSVGRPPIVVDVLLSQFAYKDNETFAGAVDLLLAADDAVYGDGTAGDGSGPHDAAICDEMKTERGINATGCL